MPVVDRARSCDSRRVPGRRGGTAGSPRDPATSRSTCPPARRRPSLLPDLGPVVAKVSRQSLTSSYLDNPVLPELEARLLDGWPFRAEALTVVDGAMDALDRVAQVVVRLGDRVIVEHPTFPPLLDLLDELGAEVIGVDVDDEGPVVAQFVDALRMQPVAVFLQPRAHNPTGVTTTTRRMKALAAELATSDDDRGRGRPLRRHRHRRAGQRRLVRAAANRSHPQLLQEPRSRPASRGGRRRGRRRHRGGQSAAARARVGAVASCRRCCWRCSTTSATIAAVASARAEYARRRQLVADVLESRGVTVTGSDGINLWMTVADERSALVTLAAQGIGAAPGEPFQVRRDAPHLRVTVGLIEADHERIADQLAGAAGGSRSPRGHR